MSTPSQEDLDEAMAPLTNSLTKAKEMLAKQDTFIQRVTALPSEFATVISVNIANPRHGKTAVIHKGDSFYEVEMPTEFPVEPGNRVRVQVETHQILSVIPFTEVGEVVTVTKVLDKVRVEIDHAGKAELVYKSEKLVVEEGDQVMLDQDAIMILQNFGKESRSFAINEINKVTWDDIGGLEEAKQQMIEAVEFPLKHAKLYENYNKKPVKGVLLLGPPGCGKTMLGKAVVSSIQNIYGTMSGADSAFMYIKGPEILSKWVGVAEETIRKIFAMAKRHKKTHGYPAVLFVDEAEAILNKRGSGVSSDIERTIVPAFLEEMNGLEDSGALVILATNRPDILDPAVVREGRIDRKVIVGRPDIESARQIFKVHMKKIPVTSGVTKEHVISESAKHFFSEEHVIYRIGMRNGDHVDFCLRDIASGAMIATIIDQATTFAIRRDIKSKTTDGIRMVDMTNAITSMADQHRHTDHTDDLKEFTFSFTKDIASINPVRRREEVHGS
jgi:proteasome-associated ATPase